MLNSKESLKNNIQIAQYLSGLRCTQKCSNIFVDHSTRKFYII